MTTYDLIRSYTIQQVACLQSRSRRTAGRRVRRSDGPGNPVSVSTKKMERAIKRAEHIISRIYAEHYLMMLVYQADTFTQARQLAQE